MNKIRKKLFLIYSTIISVLLTGLVSAQTSLSEAVKEFQQFDIVKSYLTIPSVVDLLLLYALFLNIFREVLKKREFPKAVPTVLAIIAAIGGVIGLNNLNTNLVLFVWPILGLGLIYYLIRFHDNKALTGGLGFLILYKILSMIEETMPAAQTFPFFLLLKSTLLLAGVIMTGMGIWQMISGATTGEKGVAQNIAEGIGGAKKIKDAYKDFKGEKPPKSEEEALEKLKKDFGKMQKYLEKIELELRNFGLLDAQEVEEAEKQHNILSKSEHIFLENKSKKLEPAIFKKLMQDLDGFKNFINENEKAHRWGVRDISRIAAREENEIKKIQSTLDYLKEHPDKEIQDFYNRSEEIFRSIDQLVSYIQGIREKIMGEDEETHKIEKEVTKLIEELDKTAKLVAPKDKVFTEEEYRKHFENLMRQITSITKQLDQLIKTLRELYEYVRNAHTMVPQIRKEVGELINYTKGLQKS